MKKNTLFPIILVLLVLGGLGLSQLNNSNKPSTPPRPEIPKENQKDLQDDFASISTLVYGVRGSKESVVAAVNDSGKNNSPVSLIPSDTKFAYPLSNSKQILYIAETNEYDMGKKLVVKNIVPDGALPDGAEIVIYEAEGDYRIDRYVISENNEWITWYEVRPAFGTVPTHTTDYYKSFKANMKDIVQNGGRTKVNAIQLTDEKAESGKSVNLPILVTNTGKVYFDAVIPGTYALSSGFRDESLNTILSADTYNSTPYFFNQRYILYSAFDPNNSKFPDDGDKDSTRPSLINTNIVKVYDFDKKTESIAAPGDEGEQYKHPVYIEGDPESSLTIAAEIYKIEDVAGVKKFVAKELQLITSSNGTFEKKTIASFSDSARQIIVGIGALPNGNKTLIVGSEGDTLGNFGTGNGISASGYRKMINDISVYDLKELKKITTITSFTSSQFEYLGTLPKTPDEKIGIERNTKIDKEALERTKKQLQLGTFVPVQPKRARKNPRSECEAEWEKKGYPNYEACEACPIYVYSDEGIKDVSIRPLTPISEVSSNMPLQNGSWNFQADEAGKLSSGGKTYENIDFYFPRSDFKVPEKGWIIMRDEMSQKLKTIAHSIGFTERETNDIIKHFEANVNMDTFFLGVLDQNEGKKILDLEVMPSPDSVVSILFYVRDLSGQSIKKPAPDMTSFSRKDYSVVTWGVVSE